jgi:hypothetical protein
MKALLAELRALQRLWSVRLAALAGLIVAWLMSDPTLLPRMVAYVPEPWRPVASVLVGFTAFALPTIARRLPQPPKTGDGQ